MKRRILKIFAAIVGLYLLTFGIHVGLAAVHAKNYLASLSGEYDRATLDKQSANLANDVDQLELTDIPEISATQILTHTRQMDFPEKYFLSPAWRTWIQVLADRAPVVLITAPRHSRARRLADSYLASYMADEFTVISA